jgi:peptidyl-prolyl cis-trans isomerase D
MMRQMRENTKWIMLITALAFVALMVFEWGMDITGQSGGVMELGRVNGQPVLYDQYQFTYRNLYQQVQDGQEEPVTSQQNAEIEDAAWDEVVNQILIQQELERRGIRVTDDEVRLAAFNSPPPEFQTNPAFLTEGQFDLAKYQDFLANAADELLLLQLEAYYRDVLPRGKLLRQVSTGVYFSDADLWRRYRDNEERVQVRFVPLNPVQRVADDQVEITDGEIEDYYRTNREDFATPARADLKVVVIPKSISGADSAAALDRANAVRDEIMNGAEFEAVARRESSDPTVATNGGDLGVFERGDMVSAFEEAAFGARVGSITEPVETSFGYHVIQVTQNWGDSVQARHILIPIERTDDSEIALLTLADSLETLGESLPLEEAAASLGLEVATQSVTEDFPFVAGAGRISEGVDWALQDAAPGDVSVVFETSDAFYGLELVGAVEAGYLELDEARVGITSTLMTRKKVDMAAAEGDEILGRVRAGEGMDEIAVERDLEIRTSEPFSRTGFVPGLGRQNAAVGAAFGMNMGEWSDVVRIPDNAFLLQVVDYQAADSLAWEAQKDLQRTRLASIEQQTRLGEWLDGLRDAADILDRREEVFQAAEEAPLNPFMGIGY